MASVEILEATPSNFHELVLAPRGVLIVVDFWGPNCPNCEVFARDLDSLIVDLPPGKVRIVKVNAYEHPTLARDFGLYGVPTFVLVRDGRRLGKMSQYSGREHWLGVIHSALE